VLVSWEQVVVDDAADQRQAYHMPGQEGDENLVTTWHRASGFALPQAPAIKERQKVEYVHQTTLKSLLCSSLLSVALGNVTIRRLLKTLGCTAVCRSRYTASPHCTFKCVSLVG
jgi:hypothetical protein